MGRGARLIDVRENTIAIYSDLACPFAHVAISRLWRARRRLGLEDTVLFDVRAFQLELINRRPTPKPILDIEGETLSHIEPDAGWTTWKPPDYTYAVSSLLAMEAVQAAKQQDLCASEQLDRALRRAFFGEARCITMWDVVIDVAEECDAVDPEALELAMARGEGRADVMAQLADAFSNTVTGSPHLFLADGTSAFNPGIEKHWTGKPGKSELVIDRDDKSVHDDLLRRAATIAS